MVHCPKPARTALQSRQALLDYVVPAFDSPDWAARAIRLPRTNDNGYCDGLSIWTGRLGSAYSAVKLGEEWGSPPHSRVIVCVTV